jgi:TonB family protein
VAGTVAHAQDPPAAGAEPPRRVERIEPPVTEVAKRPAVDVEATRAAVRSQIAPLQQCYERAKMDDATLKGTVTARLTVAPDGSVANVQISSSTLNSAQTERCIVGEIARWQLPRPTGGAAVSFTYPFVFE